MTAQVLKLAASLSLVAVIGILECVRRQKEERRWLAQSVHEDDMSEDYELESIIAHVGHAQLAPALEELQDAIKAADAPRVQSVLNAMGGHHPDSMKLERGLTPLLMAASWRVQDGEHDASLREIMHMLLQRGAFITQREEVSDATVMHLLACQPADCSVSHRTHYLLNILDQYRTGSDEGAWMLGLAFDPVLNGLSARGTAADAFGTAVHLLGMRCYRGMLPEELAPSGMQRDMLQIHRGLLPLGLQDSGVRRRMPI